MVEKISPGISNIDYPIDRRRLVEVADHSKTCQITNTLLVPANYRRRWLCISNVGADSKLHLALGVPAVLNNGICLQASAAAVLDRFVIDSSNWYGGPIYGITDTNVNAVAITEIYDREGQ